MVVNCDGGGGRSGRAVTMVCDSLSFQTLRETLRHLTDMLLSLRNRNGSDECIIDMYLSLFVLESISLCLLSSHLL